MSNKDEEFLPLNCLERVLAGLIAIGAICFSVWLILTPPNRSTEVDDPISVQTITTTQSDQTTVVVALLTASAALLLYAINGLRMNKFSVGSISGESSRNPGSASPDIATPTSTAAGEQRDVAGELARFNALTDPQKKILRTLWWYQTRAFPDFSRIWTFKLPANAIEYPEFLIALGELLKAGLAIVNPANEQCALTTDGINMLRSLSEEARKGAIYMFP